MLNSQAIVRVSGGTDLSEWRLIELMKRYFSTATPEGKISQTTTQVKARLPREKTFHSFLFVCLFSFFLNPCLY